MRSAPIVAPTALPTLGAYSAPVPIATAPSAPVVSPYAGTTSGAVSAPVAMPAHSAPTVMPYAMPPVATAIGPSMVRGPSQWGRRWPLLVVLLAAAAIVVSIVLLILPDKEANAARRHGAPPPTPDHMNTNPMPPSGPDPWGMAPPVDPPPPQAPADPDSDDIWGGGAPGGGVPSGAAIPAPPADEFIATLGVTVCRRLTSCAGTTLDCTTYGEMFSSSAMPGLSTCSSYDRRKASSCLTSLSNFPCSSSGQIDPAQMRNLVTGIPDCFDACQ